MNPALKQHFHSEESEVETILKLIFIYLYTHFALSWLKQGTIRYIRTTNEYNIHLPVSQLFTGVTIQKLFLISHPHFALSRLKQRDYNHHLPVTLLI